MKRWLLLLGLLGGPLSAGEETLKKISSDHGLSLTISGMVIVFAGLACISFFIAMLPKVLRLLELQGAASIAPAAAAPPPGWLDEGSLAAVALVLHAEAERAMGQKMKVTLGLNPSPWALSNQMRTIPGRIKS